MKVIIDMPEETYKGIMLGKWDANGLAFYVKTGTPLDDVIDKIRDIPTYERDGYWVMADIWKVIHDIEKESEGE